MEVTYYDQIINHFNFVFDNINGDNELSTVEKKLFIDFINNEKIEDTIPLDEFIRLLNFNFFYKNQLIRINERGQLYSGNIGHIVTEIKFYEIIKQNIDHISPELVVSKNEFLKSFFDDFDFEIYQILLKDVEIGKFIMWSFMNDSLDENVFSNLQLNEIACILGLDDETINSQKIAIEHSIDELIVKPTFFDAGLSEFWIPGGKTKPRSYCNDKSGLDEFVHKPNTFNNIIKRQSIR